MLLVNVFWTQEWNGRLSTQRECFRKLLLTSVLLGFLRLDSVVTYFVITFFFLKLLLHVIFIITLHKALVKWFPLQFSNSIIRKQYDEHPHCAKLFHSAVTIFNYIRPVQILLHFSKDSVEFFFKLFVTISMKAKWNMWNTNCSPSKTRKPLCIYAYSISIYIIYTIKCYW